MREWIQGQIKEKCMDCIRGGKFLELFLDLNSRRIFHNNFPSNFNSGKYEMASGNRIVSVACPNDNHFF